MMWWILFNVINVNSWLYTINIGTESFFITFVINSRAMYESWGCLYLPMNKDTIFDTQNHVTSSWSSCMNCMYLENEWHFIYKNTVTENFRNQKHPVTQMTKFYVAPHHNCGYWIWNVLHVTFLAHQISSWLLDFLKNLWTLALSAKNA